MIVRPDWLRRRYLISAGIIAAAIVLMVDMGSRSRARPPLGSFASRDARTVRIDGAELVRVYDPWRLYDSPSATERTEPKRAR
jgi:hypothetical protein